MSGNTGGLEGARVDMARHLRKAVTAFTNVAWH